MSKDIIICLCAIGGSFLHLLLVILPSFCRLFFMYFLFTPTGSGDFISLEGLLQMLLFMTRRLGIVQLGDARWELAKSSITIRSFMKIKTHYLCGCLWQLLSFTA